MLTQTSHQSDVSSPGRFTRAVSVASGVATTSLVGRVDMSGDRLPPAPSSAGPNRVIYVSRHDPDYAQSQERALKSSMSPGSTLTPIFTGSTINKLKRQLASGRIEHPTS